MQITNIQQYLQSINVRYLNMSTIYLNVCKYYKYCAYAAWAELYEAVVGVAGSLGHLSRI